MTDTIKILTEQIPGPPGPTIATATAVAGVTRGLAFVTVAGGVRIADTAGLALNPVPSGLIITTVAANETTTVQTSGIVLASITGLPSGAACPVGIDATGALVRFDDVNIVDGFYVGDCNTAGDFTVNYRESLTENIGDGRFSLTTANATPTTIATIAIADETIVTIEAYCEAKLAGAGTWAFIAKRDVYGRTAAGSPSQVDAVEVLAKRPAATSYDVTFSVSGNNVLVKVTGAANVKWTAEVKALKLSDG